MSEEEPDRMPEEQEVIDQITESRGEEFADEHEELILAQARLIGDL